MKKWISVILYALILFSIVYQGVYKYPRWKKGGSEAVISWDVSGYYYYLPAFLIYRDPAGLGFSKYIIKNYHPGSPVLDQATKAPNGNYIIKYSSGMAFLYLPWFVIAHYAAPHFSYPADGFSFPYQLMISLGCILYGFIGLFVLRWVLKKYFSGLAVALTLFAIVACSNYLCYASSESPNSHVPVFMLYAFVLFFTYKWYNNPRVIYAIMTGLFIGWAALCRPTDIFSFLIPVLWQLDFTWTDIKKRIAFWSSKWSHLLGAFIAVVAVGSIQLAYWKIFSGHFFYYSYGDETFHFLKVNASKCLFSFRKGWFVYSPVMILIIPGFYFLFRNFRKLFLLPFIFFLIYAYVAFSWQSWWYGGGFGQRELVQTYALLAFPIAGFFQYILSRGKILKFLTTVFLGFCFWLNMVFMYQCSDNFPWECEYMTRAYFLKIFGHTHVPIEYTLFLDHDEEYTGNTNLLKTAYQNNFDGAYQPYSDSAFHYSMPYSIKCNQSIDFYPNFSLSKNQFDVGNKGWFRVSAKFLSPEKLWGWQNMVGFVVSFQKDQKSVKQKMIRPQRALEANKWKEINFDIENPGTDYDSIKITFMSNHQGYDLFMDDLKIAVKK